VFGSSGCFHCAVCQLQKEGDRDAMISCTDPSIPETN
jgi:hypothetical protein